MGLLSFGLLALGIGINYILFPTKGSPRGPAFLFVAVGLWFLGVSLASFFFTAQRVRMNDQGAVIFSSRRRDLLVEAGELVSVHIIPLDWNRLLPMRVRARQGSIFLWSRFTDMESMWRTLQTHSPDADMDRPHPRWYLN